MDALRKEDIYTVDDIYAQMSHELCKWIVLRILRQGGDCGECFPRSEVQTGDPENFVSADCIRW